MNLVVLDAASMGNDLDFSVLEQFGTVTVFDATPREKLSAHLSQAECIIVNKVKLDAQALALAPKLRLICEFATGYDNIDLPYCRAHQIAVTNVKGYSTHAVAQLTVAMALSLIQHLPHFAGHVATGAYSAGGKANLLTPRFHELYGKTWGVIGLGNIGKEVAGVASAFGCRVLACKRTPEEGYSCVDLDTLLKTADIISLHTPLNNETRGMISAEKIALMKPTALFINVARGAVTDEKALAEAVLQGKIGGIGVDVYSAEPFPADHPFTELLELENVCLTPHMAWASVEARELCLSMTVDHIRAYQNGERDSRVD